MAGIPNFRSALNLQKAERSTKPPVLAKPARPSAKQGLRYEAKVERELASLSARGLFSQVERTPWFDFADSLGSSCCAPDFVLHQPGGAIIVIEVKLTWVPVALPKLRQLYIPVVSKALHSNVIFPLVIVKNLTPDAPPAEFTLSRALASKSCLLYWPDNGPMQW